MSEGEVKNCPKCGGQTEKRYLQGYGGAYKLLTESDSFWFPGKREKVVAFVCQKCGFIELYKEM